MSPKTTVTAGEKALITASFTNPPTGTVNHVVITITIARPPGEIALQLFDGCKEASANNQPSAEKTLVECPVGQVQASGTPVIRRVIFSPSSVPLTQIEIDASASFDEMGSGGGKKAVVSSISTDPAGTKTITVGDPNDGDNRSGCVAPSSSLSTAGQGSLNLATSLLLTTTSASLCAAVQIEHKSSASYTCNGNPCTTNVSFVTFLGDGTATVNFYFPPPGGVPQSLTLYYFADETTTDGTPLASCESTGGERPCYVSITRFPSERRIEAVVKLSDDEVDPGIAG